MVKTLVLVTLIGLWLGAGVGHGTHTTHNAVDRTIIELTIIGHYPN